jgi:hypothetical protein
VLPPRDGRTEMIPRRYPIVIEQTGSGFSAYSPDVLGCVANWRAIAKSLLTRTPAQAPYEFLTVQLLLHYLCGFKFVS